ncbi:MAG: hypothetical protein ACXAC8_13860 [Candidatus Hodarchaeales archaeon]
MSNNESALKWDSEFKKFLKQWFSGLMEGMEQLNDETWPKILEMTGRACARVHAVELFQNTWENSENMDDFIIKINTALGAKIYERIDDKTLSASYSQCYCPLVKHGLIDSPILCNCSPNWLIENFETILEKPVTVTTNRTIIRGAKTCNFTIAYDS